MGVVWQDDCGESGKYWEQYRKCIQVGLDNLTNLGTSRPLLKVRTVIKGPSDLMVDILARLNGHLFIPDWQSAYPGEIPVLVNNPDSGAKEVVKETQGTTKILNLLAKGKLRELKVDAEPSTVNTTHHIAHHMAPKTVAKIAGKMASRLSSEDVAACMSKVEASGNPLDIQAGEIEFAMKIQKQLKEAQQAQERLNRGNGEGCSKQYAKPDVFEAYQKHLGSGGKPLKEIAVKRKDDTPRKVDPKENWGKWQRLGGDTRMHQAFPLDGAPYKPTEFTKWVGPENPDYPDEGKDDDTVKSLSEDTKRSTKMLPAISSEQLTIALEAMELEKKNVQASFPVAAKGFAQARGFSKDDDDIFIPDIGKPPSAIKSSKKTTPINALRAGPPMHKKVETLRAILPPVTPQSSLGGSAYLNALGSSGIAPPPGIYNSLSVMASTPTPSFQSQASSSLSPMGSTPSPSNPLQASASNSFSPIGSSLSPSFQPQVSASNSFSPIGSSPPPSFQPQASAAQTQASGTPSQNPYQATMNQSPSPPLTNWTSPAPAPSLGSGGFYETTTPDAGREIGRMRSGSGLGHIARTASRSGFHSNFTPLRADSPAFQSTSEPTRTVYLPPASDNENQQPGGQGQGVSRRSRAAAIKGQQAGVALSGSLGAGVGGQPSYGINNDVDIDPLRNAAKKWFA
jgi:hypothetical protein